MSSASSIARDAATSLYMLAGGVGKIRMNRDATLKDIRSWRAFIMSSGEMTVETKMTQMRGAKAYTGATLRLLNVSADRGLDFGAFDNAGSTGEVRELVKAFAEAAAECHGVAGPEFVKQLLARGEAGEGVRNAIDDFVRQNVEVGCSRPDRACGETLRADCGGGGTGDGVRHHRLGGGRRDRGGGDGVQEVDGGPRRRRQGAGRGSRRDQAGHLHHRATTAKAVSTRSMSTAFRLNRPGRRGEVAAGTAAGVRPLWLAEV